MTRNRHGQWFFPSTRMGDQVPAQRIVVYEFKLKADYPGKIVVAEDGMEVELEQSAFVHLELSPQLHLPPAQDAASRRKT